MIWAVKMGGKVRNPWECSDSPQLQGSEFQPLKKNILFKFPETFLQNH